MSRIKVIEVKIVQTEESWMIVCERVRDPAHSLSPLRQAFYILKCILEGRTRKEIVEEFDDDQLVLIRINYLIERNYLNNVSVVTNEGYAFLRNFIDSTTREITTLYK
ncbi:MAG: hypothetical protein WCC17_21100 [Candidatus Nitrosopolaris sp.]